MLAGGTVGGVCLENAGELGGGSSWGLALLVLVYNRETLSAYIQIRKMLDMQVDSLSREGLECVSSGRGGVAGTHSQQPPGRSAPMTEPGRSHRLLSQDCREAPSFPPQTPGIQDPSDHRPVRPG